MVIYLRYVYETAALGFDLIYRMKKQKKERLSSILSSLSIQEKTTAKRTLKIESKYDNRMKEEMTKNGYSLLNQQIKQIVQKEELGIQEKRRSMEEEEFTNMKKKLKNYGKNQYEFLINKIIRFECQGKTPLKKIHTNSENKVLISKQYNIKLSQKVDAIIQSEKIGRIKQQRQRYLNQILQQPLRKKLKKFHSLHHSARPMSSLETSESVHSLKKVSQSLHGNSFRQSENLNKTLYRPRQSLNFHLNHEYHECNQSDQKNDSLKDFLHRSQKSQTCFAKGKKLRRKPLKRADSNIVEQMRA